jgi:GDP-L-fucose synthase
VVECWGTGEATREFLYAGDAAEAIVRAVVSELDHPEPINLGTGRDISIKDLAHLIGKLMDFKGDIVFTGEVSDGQPKRRLDVARAKEVLGWEAQTSFVGGLTQTIDWYQSRN